MEVKTHRGQGPLQHIVEIGPHTLLTDAPKIYGGEETGPEPHELLAASLAACTAITITMYARRKSMDLDDVNVRVTHGQSDGAYQLTRHIHYIGALSEEDKQRLTDVANKCPVHKTLSNAIAIVTSAS